jgi:CDP-diacylglycerol--glycerol-3-phosphate 3-phosphatidyltransferase/cardiolipin synthase
MLLTWLRILLVPLFVAILYLPEELIDSRKGNLTAMGIFIAAALTDWLDGYLARTLKQTSAFGAFLDPVADKLMVTAALICLVELSRVNAAVAFIIIGREIAISALREWMAKLGESKSVAVSVLGKIKTIAQMVAIPFLLYKDNLFGLINAKQVGTWLIWIAAVLTLWSMFHYLRMAGPLAVRGRAKARELEA